MDFFTTASLTAASVVLLVQEILKLKVVPLSFANKYPVQTNVVLSILATLWLVPIKWDWDNAGHIAMQIVTVGVTAAIAYNQLFGKSDQLRAMEGDGKKK